MRKFTSLLLIPLVFLIAGLFNEVAAQCENTSSFGTATATNDGSVVTISTCNYTSEYSTINGVLTGHNYEFSCTLSGTHKYVTLRDAGVGGAVLDHGASPFTWAATYDGTVYAHWTDDAACATTSSCHITTVQYVGCENTSSYGTATVDPGGAVTNISTCNYTSEYSTVDGIVSGSDYEFTCTLSGTHKYVTLRDAASGGAILATGPSPLTWTATLTGTVYPHWSDDATCATTASCHITTVQYLAACADPTTLLASGITTNSADIDWTEAGTATTWEYDYGLAGYGGPTGAGTSTTTKPVSLTGLASSTTYDWYVRADCGGGLYSNWVMSSFTTACGANTTFPYFEDFEGAAWLPVCWSAYLPGGTTPNNITQDAAQNHTTGGTYSARFSSYSSGTDYNQYLFSEPQTIDAGYTQLSFWHRKYNTGGELLEWGISTSTDPGTFTWTAVTLDNLAWQETVVDLSSYIGQTVYIGFHYFGNYLYYVYLDDVSIDVAPSCPDPTALNETVIISSGATLGWTSAESFFDVYVVPTGDPAPTAGSTPTADDVSNPYTWSGGAAATTYDWYVRADCAAGGGSGQSDWVGPNTFTTACAAINTFPATEDFENAGAIPACWAGVTSPGGDNWQFVTSMGWGANADHTSGLGYFAAIDDSETPIADPADLYSPIYDITGLTAPRLGFYYWIGTGSPSSTLYVDIYDGTIWNNAVATLTANGQWDFYTIDLLPYQSASTQIRFSGEEYYATYQYQSDISLDDVVIEETPLSVLSWYNYQWFDFATIAVDETATAYAQCWESGVTEAAGPGVGIECWIGYSTSDTDPATWTDWVPASYNFGVDPSNNDEYTAELGSTQGLAVGTYYVASRFRYSGGPFTYGGYNSGAWDGVTNVSGVLTVTPCSVENVPYFENFDGVVAPAFPGCMTVENTNADAYEWTTDAVALSAPNSARIRYNSALAMDDWFFTKGLALTGGVTYEVAFAYAAGSATWPENLEVDWGTDALSTSMSGTPIFSQTGIAGGWYAGNGTFTPATTGTYYVGFHGFSDADQFYLYVDDISVVEVVTTTNWSGATNNDWQNTGNWTGGLPTSGTAVTIPAGVPNFPTVGAASQCGSILVESGASLIDNGLLITGSATVERDYSGNQWHLIAAPVTGVESGLFTGLYLQTHDEASNTYSDVIPVDVPLTPGQGFALWNQNGGATASFAGALTFSASRSLTRSAAGVGNGWNLVGNPYPSSIDWEAAAGWTKTNVAASTYRFDGAGSGNWAVWNGTVGTNGATQFIASSQGFFVSVNDDGSTTGTLDFANDVRVHDNTAFFKDSPADIVKLKVSGSTYSDEAVVYFREEATEEFDSQMDAHQIPSLEITAPYIYSTANEGMAINVLPEITTVPMNVKVGIESGTYTIETVSNGEFSDLYLEDISTGIITNLNTDSYTFEYIPGVDSRFNLHFSTLSIDPNDEALFNVYSYRKDVFVTVPENTKGTITVFDMMGREVISQSINNTVNKVSLEKSAYYVVEVLSNETVVTEKVFIK